MLLHNTRGQQVPIPLLVVLTVTCKMFLTTLAAIGVILVLCLTLRYRTRMAALIAWIVGSIVGAKNADQKSPDLYQSSKKNKNSNSRQSPTKSTKSVKKTVPGITLSEPEGPAVEISVKETPSLSKQKKKTVNVSKYQATSVHETRRRSLDFNTLVDKLDKIQEKSDSKEEVLASESIREDSFTLVKSRKKRPSPPKKIEDTTATKNVAEGNKKAEFHQKRTTEKVETQEKSKENIKEVKLSKKDAGKDPEEKQNTKKEKQTSQKLENKTGIEANTTKKVAELDKRTQLQLGKQILQTKEEIVEVREKIQENKTNVKSKKVESVQEIKDQKEKANKEVELKQNIKRKQTSEQKLESKTSIESNTIKKESQQILQKEKETVAIKIETQQKSQENKANVKSPKEETVQDIKEQKKKADKEVEPKQNIKRKQTSEQKLESKTSIETNTSKKELQKEKETAVIKIETQQKSQENKANLKSPKEENIHDLKDQKTKSAKEVERKQSIKKEQTSEQKLESKTSIETSTSKKESQPERQILQKDKKIVAIKTEIQEKSQENKADLKSLKEENIHDIKYQKKKADKEVGVTQTSEQKLESKTNLEASTGKSVGEKQEKIELPLGRQILQKQKETTVEKVVERENKTSFRSNKEQNIIKETTTKKVEVKGDKQTVQKSQESTLEPNAGIENLGKVITAERQLKVNKDYEEKPITKKEELIKIQETHSVQIKPVTDKTLKNAEVNKENYLEQSDTGKLITQKDQQIRAEQIFTESKVQTEQYQEINKVKEDVKVNKHLTELQSAKKAQETVVQKSSTSETISKDITESQSYKESGTYSSIQIKRDVRFKSEERIIQKVQKIETQKVETSHNIQIHSKKQTEEEPLQHIEHIQKKLPVIQNQIVAENLVLDNLSKSSIIEHYSVKSKRLISTNQTTNGIEKADKSTIKKLEANLTPAVIAPETSTSSLIEKSEFILQDSQTLPTSQNFQKPPTSQDSQKPSVSQSTPQVPNIKVPTMKVVTQVRVLTLNDNEHQDSTLYRIEKNWIIQFRLGPSLFGRKVSLYCNYPQTKDGRVMQFDRNRYYLIQWNQDEGCHNADDTALFAEIPVKQAGSFHYYFIYENATEAGPHGSGFFLVDPVLKYGNNEELPLNCIQCQTVLSKCLGPFSTWESKLRVAKESGYNMIHFTPIQELGESNSAYSLSGQLKLNPTFNENNAKVSFGDVEKLISKVRTEWKVLSICDIVLNHTANETDWLQEHPESTFNCLNCPYMRPAYLLDAALHQFSDDVKNGYYETFGIPMPVCTEDHLNAVRHVLHTKVLPAVNIPEMYICNVGKLVSQFLESARKVPPNANNNNPDKKLKLIRDPMYRRLAATVDMDLALQIYNVFRSDSFDEDSRLRRCGEDFKNRLDQLNKEIVDELIQHISAAVENTIAGIRYFRVQHDGPRVTEITINNPLVFRYFTDYGTPKSVKEHEEIMYGPNSKYLMAHNGWVMNADPMKNFAESDSNVYIRRELIAWGDSVKLRFGDKPEDSPFLWNHMKAYVEQTAKIFDGVRLDNCHSTPIPVAEYLLDCARRVRPDLYIVAELFTNSDHTDNIFVNRLGISSLIREAMSAWDSHEEGRLVYRYGGDPVGAFFQPNVRPLVPSIAHALFLDLTHDNPSPVEKRSVFDMLPSSALVNMACCASGSNRGYDELINHHIHVVEEHRQYTEWTSDETLLATNPRYVSHKSGIISAKRAINELHFRLGVEGYNQVYVDQMDPDIVAVTRHRPDTHQSVILVAFTAFGHPSEDAANYQRGIKPLRVEGALDEIILEATLNHSSTEKGSSKYSRPKNFAKNDKYINGVSEYAVEIKQHIQLENSDVFELGHSGNPNITQLNFKNFKPGSVVAIKVSLPKNVQQSIHKLRDLMLSFSRKETSGLSDVIGKLNLADLNRALYRCDQEERDDGKGFGAYSIPNFESLVYCGLQGFMSLLSTIRPSNDLGHPMCGNLRDGNWMMDYISQRLMVDDGTKELGQWIDKNIQPLKDIPRYLIPSYFDVIVTGVYINLLEQSYKLMSNFISNGSTFVKGLALGSLQFSAVIKSADLPTLSPNLTPPKPPTRKNDQGKVVQACVTLSAGLPHFSTGYMRNWGRDTFIALRGLFILTGRFQDARYHILGYGACLRHGLIPNLLDGGRNSRFNCRDAVWWWLYCIKSYVEEAPNGIEILSDKVSRIFPTDDSPALEPGAADQPLHQVIQEALNIHFQGLAFRERNAGRQIDEHMTDKGFNNQVGVHPETGFVFGGNEWNCGTWMDKMGSSDKAGIRGKPATPRDGSAVELVGLSMATVTWIAQLYDRKQYPYAGVERISKSGSTVKWTFKEWAEKIKSSFEKHFWINTTPVQDEYRQDLINKRGVYKDSYGASQPWTDFQMRCNFPIAMVAAPEMFDAKHAWIALQNAEKSLLGPLGMKTLDSSDWAYCGDYDNADDSDSSKTSHGFNYHQGPEWVWPVGYYLRARLLFAAANGELARTVANTKVVLAKHFTELQTSAWRGLPELTNSNGSFCYFSSRTQAWSMSCILEVLHDLQRIESKQQPNTVN